MSKLASVYFTDPGISSGTVGAISGETYIDVNVSNKVFKRDFDIENFPEYIYLPGGVPLPFKIDTGYGYSAGPRRSNPW